MRFRVIAQPMAEWKQWLADQQDGPAQPWSGEIKDLKTAAVLALL